MTYSQTGFQSAPIQPPQPPQYGQPQQPQFGQPTPPKKRPIFKRWWFWVIVVVVLVGIGAAIDQGGQKGSETPVAKEPTANQPTANDSTDREPKAETAPDEALGSRDNPYPLGTVIHGKEYDVTVNSVTVGATDAVLAANMLNQAPPEGQSYAVINLTITYTGEGSGFADFVTVAYVASTGEVYDGLGTVTVAPEPTIGLDELYSGGTVTGNKVLPIPDGETGLLRVSPGVMANEVFVAL